VTDPQLEELEEGATPRSGGVGGLHPWEAPAACTGMPKLSPQQEGCKGHVYFPTVTREGGRGVHTCTKAQHQQSASPTSPFIFGDLVFNPCRMGTASKPSIPPAGLPPGHQTLCKRWSVAVFSRELIATVFCKDPSPYQKALVVTA